MKSKEIYRIVLPPIFWYCHNQSAFAALIDERTITKRRCGNGLRLFFSQSPAGLTAPLSFSQTLILP